jgi:prepilin-type N-terminal cleavage/methylation domain-containing protein
MRSERGYTLFEIIIVVALIGVISGIALPVFMSTNEMNSLWTSSERLGALMRQTRLKAITQNRTYQIRFSCPGVGQARGLVMTGDTTIDDAPARCSTYSGGDSQIVEMNGGVTFDAGATTALQVTGRGTFTTVGGGTIPLTVDVTYGANNRYLTISATGQITFSDIAPVVPEE